MGCISRLGFQSTPPMRGATITTMAKEGHTNLFQSTPPMRGATLYNSVNYKPGDISIHTPHAGSDFICSWDYGSEIISIHAPHAGSDDVGTRENYEKFCISIHAPHAGSDQPDQEVNQNGKDFNPCPPCGERLFPICHRNLS